MIRVPAAALLVLLSACSKPQVPERDRPVDPQAAIPHDAGGRPVDAPRGKARGAQAAAAATRDEAIATAPTGARAGGQPGAGAPGSRQLRAMPSSASIDAGLRSTRQP